MAVRKRFADNVPGLLARPMNLDTRRIFVAATRMNDGKTTTCLGLTAALQALKRRSIWCLKVEATQLCPINRTKRNVRARRKPKCISNR